MQNYPSAGTSLEKTKVMNLDSNIAALLCYFPCTALIASILFLVTEPKSNRFLRFHALQSLFFGGSTAVVVIALLIVATIIQVVLGMASGTLATLVGLVFFLVWAVLLLGVLGVAVMAMIKAYGGQQWKIPGVGALAEKYS
jgi:uncharacterized membrane protein